jgi:hypothetical protein
MKISEIVSDHTQTEEFRRWFGRSKVVDQNGRPLRVYHGTTVWADPTKQLGDINAFDRFASVNLVGRAPSMDTVGIWFSDNPGPGGAGMYAGSSGAIYPCYLRVQNPWRPGSFDKFLHAMHIRAGRNPKKQNAIGRGSTEELRDWLKQRGYDGIYFSLGSDGEFAQQNVWVALEPTQVKSAIGNPGTYSKKDPSIIETKIDEMITPDQAMRGRIYYHGTGTTENAKQIIKHGIVPGNQSGKSLGSLKPVNQATYLTPDLVYAIIYAIGGNMIGQPDPSYLIKKAGGDPYGYVFSVSGDKLNQVQPDEDSVGEAVHHAYDIIEKKQTGARFYQHNPLYANMALPENLDWTREFLRLSKYGMTPRQFRGTIDGYLAAQAAGGKRFLKMLSPGVKRKLIEFGAHVAHLGVVKPDRCWRIDRRKNPKLLKDGSNFFELAKEIPIKTT